MGLHVSPESLAKEWSLSFADIDFVNVKPVGSRLGLTIQKPPIRTKSLEILM